MPSRVLVAALVALLPASGAMAFEVKKSDSGHNVRWPEAKVSFSISSAGSRDLPEAVAIRAVQGAFAPWQHATGARVQIRYAGRTARPVGFDPKGDNESVVGWSRDAWPFEPDALAMTVTAYQQISGNLVDADILVNEANYTWGNGGGAENDLQNALTHEVGHFLGLAHSKVADATMFAQAEPWETSKRTLAADDAAGLARLYPKAAGPAMPGATAAATPGATVTQANANAAVRPRIRIKTGCDQTSSRSGPNAALLFAGLMLALRIRRFGRSNSSQKIGT